MNNILKNWNVGRIIRLLAGIGLTIYAFASKEYGFFMLAGLFLFQGILNISCCGPSGCSSGETDNQKQVYKGEIQEYKSNQK